MKRAESNIRSAFAVDLQIVSDHIDDICLRTDCFDLFIADSDHSYLRIRNEFRGRSFL